MTAALSIHQPDEQPVPFIDLTAQFQSMSAEVMAADPHALAAAHLPPSAAADLEDEIEAWLAGR